MFGGGPGVSLASCSALRFDHVKHLVMRTSLFVSGGGREACAGRDENGEQEEARRAINWLLRNYLN